MTKAAKEEIPSAPPAVLLETRVRGIAPENTTATRPESSVSSTLRWGSRQVYDRTPVGRLVGLDYFGARYLSSAQGRWSTPDVVNVTNERLVSPSSTLNKYVYAANNPLKYVDPDGRDIVVLHGEFMPVDHIMIAAHNQKTGDFAILSVGPKEHSPAILLRAFTGVPGTTAFQLGADSTADDLRRNYTALTIQTTPEVAQQAIDLIRAGAGTGNWAWLGNNCSSSTAKLLADIGIYPGNSLLPWWPTRLWDSLYDLYGKKPPESSFTVSAVPGATNYQTRFRNGQDYGDPRFGMDTFRWLELMLRGDNLKACVTVTDHATGTTSTQCQ